MSPTARRVFLVVMATIMTFLMSAAVTAINTGLGGDFVWRWLTAWSMALPIGVVGALFAAPVAQRVTRAVIEHLPRRYRAEL
ncbi:MAG: DUF2798 domain-containing protein [Pseudomonadota bacterium]